MHTKKNTRIIIFALLFAASVFVSFAAEAGNAQEGQHLFLPFVQKPGIVRVGRVEYQSTSQYGGWFYGEVINASSTQAYSVTVEATFQSYFSPPDGPGRFTETTRTYHSVTLPGSKNTFGFGFSNPPPQLISVRSDAIEVRTPTVIQLVPIPVRVQCSDPYRGYYRGTVTMKIRNDLTAPMRDIRVAVWRFSENSLRDPYDYRGATNDLLNGVVLEPGASQEYTTSPFYFCNPNIQQPVSASDFQYSIQGTVEP